MTVNLREADPIDMAEFGAGREAERQRIIAAFEAEAPSGTPAAGRLAQLADRFALEPLEADILGLLWIGAVYPGLRADLLAQATNSAHITVLLAADLFGHAPRPRLSSGSQLLLWRLVQEHELADGGAALTIDATILAWLDGVHELDRVLAGNARLLDHEPEISDWPTDAIAAKLRGGLRDGRRSRVRVQTSDPVAARWFASALGRRIGLPVLDVQPGTLVGGVEAAVRLHRQAFLDGCVPLISIEDAYLARPPAVAPYPLQIVHGPGPTMSDDADAIQIDVVLETPGPDERERLWRRLWPPSATWAEGSLADLALCHESDVADIAAVAATCPKDSQTAASSLRERLRGETAPLVRRIEPVFRWDDIVLPKQTRAQLEEIAFEARERVRLWEEPGAARLFPYGRGLVALFAGPPGTGKTMAAQVIAADLGLDLLAVDLSAVVSKWVGETAQHLQLLLSSRTSQRSILFFDEADSLYAKRVEEIRDAQDRFVNHDSSHLMTALESYPGIVILATNLKDNIDSAFLRRVRHIVDFPKADAASREAIWHKAVSVLFPKNQSKRLLRELDRVARIEASGSHIKNAALSAAFATRRTGKAPTVRLLGEMLVREAAKEGAGISPRDLDALIGPRP